MLASLDSKSLSNTSDHTRYTFYDKRPVLRYDFARQVAAMDFSDILSVTVVKESLRKTATTDVLAAALSTWR